MDDLNVLTEAAVTITHLQRKTVLLTRQWSEGKTESVLTVGSPACWKTTARWCCATVVLILGWVGGR